MRVRPTQAPLRPSLPPPNPALQRALEVKRAERHARIKLLAEEARARQQQRFREALAKRPDLLAAHQRWEEEAEWRTALNASNLQGLERAQREEQVRKPAPTALLGPARNEENAPREAKDAAREQALQVEIEVEVEEVHASQTAPVAPPRYVRVEDIPLVDPCVVELLDDDEPVDEEAEWRAAMAAAHARIERERKEEQERREAEEWEALMAAARAATQVRRKAPEWPANARPVLPW